MADRFRARHVGRIGLPQQLGSCISRGGRRLTIKLCYSCVVAEYDDASGRGDKRSRRVKQNWSYSAEPSS